MSEQLDPPDDLSSPAAAPRPPGHARRVLVALVGFGTLVAAALAVIVSLLLLGGALDGAF